MTVRKEPIAVSRLITTMGDSALLSKIRPATLDKIEKSVITLYANDNDKATADNVTMQAIAKHANVSLQTLYKYFGDKNTLIYVILDRVLSRLAARMIDHLSGIDSVKDRLRKTLWVMFDFVDHNPEAVLFFSTAIPVSHYQHIAIYENKDLMEAFLHVLSDGQQRCELNQNVSLKTLLDIFMGFITRLGLMHVLRQSRKPMTDDFDNLFDILWRAISQDDLTSKGNLSGMH